MVSRDDGLDNYRERFDDIKTTRLTLRYLIELRENGFKIDWYQSMSCPEVMYQAYYPYLYQRASTSASSPANVHRAAHFSPFSHQYDRVSWKLKIIFLIAITTNSEYLYGWNSSCSNLEIPTNEISEKCRATGANEVVCGLCRAAWYAIHLMVDTMARRTGWNVEFSLYDNWFGFLGQRKEYLFNWSTILSMRYLKSERSRGSAKNPTS